MSGQILNLGTVIVNGKRLDAYVLAPNKVKYFREDGSVNHEPPLEVVRTYVRGK